MLDFTAFARWVEYWMRELGLQDWRVQVVMESDYQNTHRLAWVRVDTVQRLATFSVNPSHRQPRDYSLPVPDPERYALHEVLHVLLAPIGDAACRMHDSGHDTVVEAEHAALNRLMAVLPQPEREVVS